MGRGDDSLAQARANMEPTDLTALPYEDWVIPDYRAAILPPATRRTERTYTWERFTSLLVPPAAGM